MAKRHQVQQVLYTCWITAKRIKKTTRETSDRNVMCYGGKQWKKTTQDSVIHPANWSLREAAQPNVTTGTSDQRQEEGREGAERSEAQRVHGHHAAVLHHGAADGPQILEELLGVWRAQGLDVCQDPLVRLQNRKTSLWFAGVQNWKIGKLFKHVCLARKKNMLASNVLLSSHHMNIALLYKNKDTMNASFQFNYYSRHIGQLCPGRSLASMNSFQQEMIWTASCSFTC